MRGPLFTQVMTAQPLHDEGELLLARLRAELWRLDLSSLLAALQAAGYRWDELRFAGRAGADSPRRLIEDVELERDPRRVRITLNLGLLGPQSPLPAYFFKELDAGTLDGAAFADFIGFFDHQVLARLVLATHPELDKRLFPDHRQSRREELQLLNLRSSATLHWLLAELFPELVLTVEPITKQRRLRTGALRLGSAVLGAGGAFGGRALAVGPGRRVTLFADDERAGSGRPWPLEARARLETHVLPLVRPFRVALEVALMVRAQARGARLGDGNHLGYEQLRGAGAPRRIEIYDSSEEDQP